MASTSDALIPSELNGTLIEQFCSVTGSDVEKAKKMLEICNWNLEMAVNMHVDSDYQDNGSVEAVASVDPEGIRAPIPQSRAVLVEEDHNFQYGLRSRKRRPHSVFDGFRDFQAEAEMQEQQTESAAEAPSVISDLKKRRTLEDLFRPPLDMMYRGNFESARDFGQMSNKWLMVNLQDSQEFSCQVLNRDVWSNPAVKSLISQHFVFWQVYSDSIDGQRYMQFYTPVVFPYIAILDPRTGEKLVVWNNVDAMSICEHIDSFLLEHTSPQEKDSHATEGSSSSTKTSSEIMACSLLDQSEEEQLRAALAASMKETNLVNIDDDSDVETFESDSEGVEGVKNNDIGKVSEASEQSNDSIDVVGVSEAKRNNLKKKIEVENWKDFLGSDDDPKSDLVLRLPDGNRQQISWPCTTKVKSLLLYIGEIGYDPEKYELVTNYPRRNLCQLDLWKSLKEVDLFPREMIFIQLKT
ncbi:hypothetical protein JTE90_014908 [Oedothorax gibbosus]|uniref:UBX domain-containing protein n=1 Tax=Oedothorax gibbosus TaxID=931172 RepID=A0AAV6VN11_9ARAC|nr:hypothetical protein JTE90_014908 [Oedothorax gibbosus]